MLYRFQLNGKSIDRHGELAACKFAASVPPETVVLIFKKPQSDAELDFVDSCKVSDIWDVPERSYQQRVMNNLKKK
jgi:hypothetical protein